ncbi:MAG: hypothetical protein AAF570_07220, partial [Bacteroidota bacterium]
MNLYRPVALLTLILLSFFFSLSAQTLELPLYFEDAAGHRDTLYLGYDLNATAGIDAAFGEVNIINDPIDSLFEVRISDGFRNYDFMNLPPTYNLKKQITPDPCAP